MVFPGSPPHRVAELPGYLRNMVFASLARQSGAHILTLPTKGHVHYAWQDAENAEQRLHQHRPTGLQLVYGTGLHNHPGPCDLATLCRATHGLSITCSNRPVHAYCLSVVVI
jgi:hypothetical protein